MGWDRWAAALCYWVYFQYILHPLGSSNLSLHSPSYTFSPLYRSFLFSIVQFHIVKVRTDYTFVEHDAAGNTNFLFWLTARSDFATCKTHRHIKIRASNQWIQPFPAIISEWFLLPRSASQIKWQSNGWNYFYFYKFHLDRIENEIEGIEPRACIKY